MNRQTRLFLQQRNATLRAENTALRQIMSCPPCSSCSRPVIPPEYVLMEQRLRQENEMIRREIKQLYRVAAWYLSWSRDNDGASSSSSTVASSDNASWRNVVGLAVDSSNEVTRLVSIGEPMWNRSEGGGNETLNLDEYYAHFLPFSPRNMEGFVHEASRATGLVAVDALSLVRDLADPNRWIEIFPSIIANASLLERHRILQVMKAEFLPIISPLVSTRKVKFIRCFEQLDPKTWIVADVSSDIRTFHHNPNLQSEFIRFPSGFIIHHINSDCSQVTIVEHWVYKEEAISTRFRSYLATGLGFGAGRWLAALQRSGFCSSFQRGMSPFAKSNLVYLSRRMVNTFCTGVCGITHHDWRRIRTDRSLDFNIKLFRRETLHEGNPCVLVSATGMVRLQAKPEVVFGLLCDARNLDLWDHFRHSGVMEEVVRVLLGPNPGNRVSIFRGRDNSSGANDKFVLQEIYHDASASMVINAAVDLAAAAVAATYGVEYSFGDLLPSGFTIMPGSQVAPAEAVAGGSRSDGGGGGDEWCDVTAGFQMVADEAALTSGEMVNAVEEMVSRALNKVRNALPVNLGLR